MTMFYMIRTMFKLWTMTYLLNMKKIVKKSVILMLSHMQPSVICMMIEQLKMI